MGRELGEIRDHEAALLLDAVQQLSLTHDVQQIGTIVKRAARQLLASDGAAFVLREQDTCVYADEDTIEPLWKGQRFPASDCLSGWAMIHRETLVIDDIGADSRVPHSFYSGTFVKSLVMVPIRRSDPLGAIGAYWAVVRHPTRREVALIEALAASAGTAMAHAELYRRLQEAIRWRDELLEVAAHELRTPLTPLRLQLDRLAGAVADGRRAADFPALIEQSRGHLERIERLVEGLLDQNSLLRDRLVLDRSEHDLGALVAGVLARTRSRAERARCPVAFEAEGSVQGSWDARRLEQVVENLLDNAWKFGQGRRIEVRVGLRRARATLSVTDHGIGIAAADHERIFERFARAVPTSHFGGFGLGLWASRRIVTAHGGSISVESRPDEGATFHVSLPLGGE